MLQREARNNILLALAIYVSCFLLNLGVGFPFRISWDYYQILRREDLLDRLASSLWYLHAQPPMLNLVLGLALKLEAPLHVRVESILLAFHFLLGAEIAVSFALFLPEFLKKPLISRICLVLILAHPALYLFQFHYFYTFHELAILAPLALMVQSELQRPAWQKYLAIAFLTILMVYTRSLFHFLWAAMILAVLALRVLLSTTPMRSQAGRYLTVLSGAALILLSWPAKNYLLFGFFGYSSWQGGNFSTGYMVSQIPPLDETLPERFRNIPVLARRIKNPGDKTEWPNMNHYSAILESKELGKLAWKSIKADPSQVLKKAFFNYWSATRFTGRHPYLGNFGLGWEPPDYQGAELRAYEILLCQEFRSEESLRDPYYRQGIPTVWLPSVFFMTFPLLLFFSLMKLFRIWKTEPLRARSAAFLLFCIFWVLAMILFVDGREGNRIRFSTEPYLITLFFWVLPSFSSPPPPKKSNAPARKKRID